MNVKNETKCRKNNFHLTINIYHAIMIINKLSGGGRYAEYKSSIRKYNN